MSKSDKPEHRGGEMVLQVAPTSAVPASGPSSSEHNAVIGACLATCAAGDRKAFERLYRLTSARLYATARRMLRSEALAQECLQDAYVSIWRNAGSYQPDKSAPLTWMTSIVRHRALDMLRTGAREVTMDDPQRLIGLVDAAAPLDGRDGPDYVPELHPCLEQLRAEQRECLRLAYFDGLSHAEVAERLMVPLGTVKSWVRRALLQLRECLG
jgi:RNA polymerase sigma-70 factor, ECF subfamily